MVFKGCVLRSSISAPSSSTGLERDSETNLDHTQFRQNSSTLGRWMTPDPAGLAVVDPTNPQSWNRYTYVMDNPLGYVDQSGQHPCPPAFASVCNLGNHSYAVSYLWDWGRAWDEFSILDMILGPGQTTDVASSINGVTLSETVTFFPGDLSLLNFIGAGVSGNSSGTRAIQPNCPTPLLPGCSTAVPAAQVIALVNKLACGNTPQDAVFKSMRSGAVRGALRGGIAGFAGGEFMGGIGGVPGAILGGFMGGTIGAAGAAISGPIRSGVCSALGAYGQ